MTRTNYPEIDILRFTCVSIMIICTFGLPISFWSAITPMLNFAPCLLFSIYGFLIFRHNEINYKKYIIRHFIAFIVSLIIYFPIAMEFTYLTTSDYSSMFALFSKESIINFLFFNVWPSCIGSAMWVFQSSLYAIIIIAIFDKLKLLRFDVIICIALFIVTIFTGELSRLVPFKFFGYGYLTGNFFTRALPYILLGKIICDKRFELRKIRTFIWEIVLILSVILCYLEIYLLSKFGLFQYKSHWISYVPITISLLVLSTKNGSALNRTRLDSILRSASFVMYITYSIIGYPLKLILLKYDLILFNKITVSGFASIITLLICSGIGLLYGLVRFTVKMKIYEIRAREENET